MTNIKYVLMVLCTFSLCAKIAGHTYRHLSPPAVAATTAQ
jgi:hypothetical protein